jgi:cytochrome c
MHFSAWEKFGFGLLVTAWLVWGSIMLGNFLVHADESQVAALRLAPAESEGEAAGGAGAAPAEPVDIVAMLPTASAENGATVFKKCQACHTSEKGGANKVGPHLWGVLDRPRATSEGFAYSNTLKGLGGDWSYEDLSHFLANPRQFAPGTKMSFAGLKKPQELADAIAFLRSLSDSPRPLP